MATDVDIANLALTRIGHAPIASFSASGNKAQRWFATHYETIAQPLMREHQWRFATKRAVLTMDRIRTIINVTLNDPQVGIESTAHGFVNGDTVYIAGVIGTTEVNGKTFTVTTASTNAFKLSGTDSADYSPYSSGGSVYGYVATEYAYRFQLPSDCLRVLRINGAERDDYRVEGGFIMTNEGTVNIEYIFDNGDESSYDAQFVDLLAARLSAEISFYMTDNSTLTEQAWNIYNNKLSLARTMDSRQGMPRGIEADTWLNARI